MKLVKIEKKKEKKNPPLLFNLAELQNECSKLFKLSPDETLRITQELYEKKLVTYPRTDARVLSTAVAKEIHKNIGGLRQIPGVKGFAEEILAGGLYKGLAKTRYVNDKQITDHYAIIPTGQGISALKGLPPISVKVYEQIVRRFLSIFYPAAVYEKIGLEFLRKGEHFFAGSKILLEEGYLKVVRSRKDEEAEASGLSLSGLQKNQNYPVKSLSVKEGETSPPKRYTSGSMILAMENAGQLIEDEELRAQIKGSGIGTSATRAEILKKLVHIKYLKLNKKTQVITPSMLGEMVFDVVGGSIPQLLNPELTASWEKGLTYVANGEITTEEYMQKLETFIKNRTYQVLRTNAHGNFRVQFDAVAPYYRKKASGKQEGAEEREEA